MRKIIVAVRKHA